MIVFLLLLASLGCLVLGIRYLRSALAVTGSATSYIRSAAQGYVVFVGEGNPLPGRRIVAPFSGKSCLWWAVQVQSLTGLTPPETEVVNSHAFDRRTSTAPFLLKDGTGECFVDPDLAEVHAATKEVWYGSMLDANAQGVGRHERRFEDDFRYVEERIDLHQRIVASGYFRTTHADPGVAMRPANDPTAAPGTNLLGPSPDGRRFVISTVPEEALAKRLRIRAALALLLFVVLAGCAVFVGEAGS
ncbi:MAG TPA: GIDE domain-containing protein [Gammaproteobacteria bacterium]|nr:GIDE domain-containing protein [Gammaproteobacteria bacterium]